jgi:REP element-mobilizing transposase RayT
VPPAAKRFITRPRLRKFDYTGMHAYHVTIVSRAREGILTARADAITLRLNESAAATNFELLIYTIMPDHLHLLVAAQDESSNLVRFVQRFKQTTGFDYSRETGHRLWQPSFHDHALRREEDLAAVAQYILDNPVRAGLVEHGETWPYCGGSYPTTTGRS